MWSHWKLALTERFGADLPEIDFIVIDRRCSRRLMRWEFPREILTISTADLDAL